MKPNKAFATLVTATAALALAGGAAAGDGDKHANRDKAMPFVAAADSNKDGNVSETEFRSHLKDRFATLDTDKNGSLTKSELPSKVAMVNDDDADPEEFIDETDANDDKQVTEAEYTQLALNEFREADENSDRMLTREERDDADGILEAMTPDSR